MSWKCPECGREIKSPRYPMRCCRVIGYSDGRIEQITLTDDEVAAAKRQNDFVVDELLPAMYGEGVGTELKNLFDELEVKESDCNSCRFLQANMNIWGITGCRKRRVEIVGQLREKYRESGIRSKLRALRRTITTGLAFKIDWKNPLNSLLDEAIRRTEAKAAL